MIFTILLFISIITYGQDTTTVEQYCDMVVTGIAFTNKLNITLDFGQERSNRLRHYKLKDEETGRPKVFNTVIDALNYMGAQGWLLVNAFPFPNGDSRIYHYYLKKRFRRSELID